MMIKVSIQIKVKQVVFVFICEVWEVGWQCVKFEIKFDGSVIVDVNMVVLEVVDDFFNSDLRMGE